LKIVHYEKTTNKDNIVLNSPKKINKLEIIFIPLIFFTTPIANRINPMINVANEVMNTNGTFLSPFLSSYPNNETYLTFMTLLPFKNLVTYSYFNFIFKYFSNAVTCIG
jgi:hypothetical protein